MKNYTYILVLFILSVPAFAQTTTNNTTTNTSTTTGTTNATVTSPGNVVVSTPNGTIGNQVNTPANTNNVYVVTPGSNSNNNNNNSHQHLSPSELARLQQQRDRSDYDRTQSQHDYRDRANYYNIRRNEAVQSDQRNSTNSVTQQNYQADYHSSYPAYYNNNHSRK